MISISSRRAYTARRMVLATTRSAAPITARSGPAPNPRRPRQTRAAPNRAAPPPPRPGLAEPLPPVLDVPDPAQLAELRGQHPDGGNRERHARLDLQRGRGRVAGEAVEGAGESSQVRP